MFNWSKIVSKNHNKGDLNHVWGHLVPRVQRVGDRGHKGE
jgi:hypothetical protein